MTDIGQIILDVLDSHPDLAGNYANAEAAELCEQKLLNASLHQLASVIGGTVEVDNDGQAVIYTNMRLGGL